MYSSNPGAKQRDEMLEKKTWRDENRSELCMNITVLSHYSQSAAEST